MKPAGSSLATYLDASTASGFLAHLFAFTAAGTTTYYTDHSANITVNGHTYLAGGVSNRPLFQVVGRSQASGMDPGEIRIVMRGGTDALWGGKSLQKAAMDRDFDSVTVRVERIFGAALGTPDTSMGSLPLHEGPISRVKIGSFSIEITVADWREGWSRPFPKRILQPGCNWQFGSTECGISLASHTFTGYSVTGTSTTALLTSSSVAGKATGYFTLGTIVFNGNVTAALGGVKRGVADHGASGVVTFDRPLPVAAASGDTFTIVAGCPKTLVACGFNGSAGKFGVINEANFGGFPFVPNPDTVGT